MHGNEMLWLDAWAWIWMTPRSFSWIVPLALAVPAIGMFIRGEGLSGNDRWRRSRRFLCHALGMTVAMGLGMVVLDMTFAWHQYTELAAFAMAFSMTLPMVALMRYRGHNWRRGGEMAAAMFLPTFPPLALFWLGLMSAHLVHPLQMVLMLPAMMLVMLYRADEHAGQACTVRVANGRPADRAGQ